MTREEKARAYDEALEVMRQWIAPCHTKEQLDTLKKSVFPELAESEGERIRKRLIEYFEGFRIGNAKVKWEGLTVQDVLAWLEKHKENPKSADSIPSNCVSNAKCDDRWHKVTDSLPDNGRLVLAQDCLGNTLLARYDGEGNWEVSVYDKDDYYCRNTITKWCEIPSEKQKEQKPADLSTMMVHKEPYIAPVPTPMIADERKQEWSEEDEKMRNALWNLLHLHYAQDNAQTLVGIEAGKFRSWLKSLRPSWKPSENELAKKHLDGYCMGREDTLREMKDFVESHFNCENAKKGTPIVYNTQSGTSTLKAEG